MNKKQRQKIYKDFLKKQTEEAGKKAALKKYKIENQSDIDPEYSPEALEVLIAFKNSDLGCKTEKLYPLIRLISKVDLPEELPEKFNGNEDRTFDIVGSSHAALAKVPWACFSYSQGSDSKILSTVLSKVDDGVLELFIDGDEVGMIVEDDLRDLTRFSFATDREIEELVAKSFTHLDDILGSLIKC